VPVGTVMSRLFRGRERLRQLLEGESTAGATPLLRRVK
jgi:DNA-directed RNA polymerase specialized sigma24 family protein